MEERLTLTFEESGSLKLEVAVELRQLENSEATKAVGQRLTELEDQLLEGLDAWQPRFSKLTPAQEDFFWQKVEGRLRFMARQAVLPNPVDLGNFLADTSIQAVYGVEDGIAELALYPGLPARANRRERKRMETAVASWSEVLAQYFAAGEELYRHLDTQPHRAEACFAHLFDHEELQAAHGPLAQEEERLIENLVERMLEVLDVLRVDSKTAYSLEELSSLVYDPFPARLQVELPNPSLEVEGFLLQADGFHIPGLSLWSALEQLSGQWLAPDPVLAQVEQWLAEPEGNFDVPTFANQPRTVQTAPDAQEIQNAIENWLTPAEVYRLRWRVPKKQPEAGP